MLIAGKPGVSYSLKSLLLLIPFPYPSLISRDITPASFLPHANQPFNLLVNPRFEATSKHALTTERGSSSLKMKDVIFFLIYYFPIHYQAELSDYFWVSFMQTYLRSSSSFSPYSRLILWSILKGK